MSLTVSCAISAESRLDLGSSEDPASAPLDDLTEQHSDFQDFFTLHSVTLVKEWLSTLGDLIFKGA